MNKYKLIAVEAGKYLVLGLAGIFLLGIVFYYNEAANYYEAVLCTVLTGSLWGWAGRIGISLMKLIRDARASTTEQPVSEPKAEGTEKAFLACS